MTGHHHHHHHRAHTMATTAGAPATHGHGHMASSAAVMATEASGDFNGSDLATTAMQFAAQTLHDMIEGGIVPAMTNGTVDGSGGVIHGDHHGSHGAGMDGDISDAVGGGGGGAHAGHTPTGGTGHDMYFRATTHSTILFQPWVTSGVGSLIGSVIAVFVMAVVLEGIRVVRERTARSADRRAAKRATQCRDSKLSVQVQWSLGDTLVQAVLHMLFFTWSYFLMLIFMTFNVWLCLGVVLGVGTGYVSFLRFRPAFQYVKSPTSSHSMYHPSEDECCV